MQEHSRRAARAPDAIDCASVERILVRGLHPREPQRHRRHVPGRRARAGRAAHRFHAPSTG